MRISKSAHLKRLLQTQDAVLCMLAFLLVADLYWVLGRVPDAALLRLVVISPALLLMGGFAAQYGQLGLHERSMMDHVTGTVRMVAVLAACLILMTYVANIEVMSRTILLSFSVAIFLIILGNRLFLRWWYLHRRREQEENFVRVLIIGTGSRAQQLMHEYQDHSEWGVKTIGLLDPDPKLKGQKIDGVPVIGVVEDIHSVLSSEIIDEVIVCLPRSMINDIESVVLACQEQAVCLNYMADFYDMKTERISVEQLGRVPLLRFEPVALNEAKLIVKRMFDLIVTIASLPIVLPLFIIVALAIKLDSKGPVFFKQERVGLNKRPFNMLKFRSMCIDAEDKLKEIEHLNEAQGPIFKMKDDPRVTRVGRFIRASSIDELPQIFNVLMGQMSLIGPRPMSMRDVGLFSSGVQRRRFSVRPGLLCLREVSGRSELTFERWLELDLQYIEQWSLWLDIKIMFRAIPAVLKGEGAS